MLEPARARRPVNPLHKGAETFERIENTRLARYAREVLLGSSMPEPRNVPPSLQKDLELVKLRLLECHAPRDFDVWLHAMVHVAKAVNPYLAADAAGEIWQRIAAAPCYRGLHEFQRRWIALAHAVALRDAASMAALASDLLATQTELNSENREFLLLAGMSGFLAAGAPQQALALWQQQANQLPRAIGKPVFRLLRCHADPGDCASEFAAYDGL
jgi:hypothetical protein